MPLTRRHLLLAATLAPAASVALAQPKAPVPGKDFREVSPPQPVESGARIEVLEFFQYGCPHCYTFTPIVEGWRKKRGAEIDYRRIHINWDGGTLNHTKLYYTLEQMNLVDKLHERVFFAIHREKRRLLDPKDIAEFMAANGVDRAQWESNFASFSVNTRASRAGQVWRAFRIEGTPAVGIDGRFVTAPSMAGTFDNAVTVMDALVARARSERPPAKK